jgi:hypothetical protein
MQDWHFVVVTDPANRAALAECFRQGWEVYKTLPISAFNVRFPDADRNAVQDRVIASPRKHRSTLQLCSSAPIGPRFSSGLSEQLISRHK